MSAARAGMAGVYRVPECGAAFPAAEGRRVTHNTSPGNPDVREPFSGQRVSDRPDPREAVPFVPVLQARHDCGPAPSPADDSPLAPRRGGIDEGRIRGGETGRTGREGCEAGVYGNRTHRELCSNPPLVLKTRARTSGANTPEKPTVVS